jgi:hypothetical protein
MTRVFVCDERKPKCRLPVSAQTHFRAAKVMSELKPRSMRGFMTPGAQGPGQGLPVSAQTHFRAAKVMSEPKPRSMRGFMTPGAQGPGQGLPVSAQTHFRAAKVMSELKPDTATAVAARTLANGPEA